jgi:hypothetical protein
VAAVDVYKLQNYVYAVKKDVSRRKTSHMKIALGGRSSGGGSKSQLMQFQADLLGMPVLCAAVAETTALCATYLGPVWPSASGQFRTPFPRKIEQAGASIPACPGVRLLNSAHAGTMHCSVPKNWENPESH